MYLWKVWLRPDPELAGWPRALDVQAFTPPAGRVVLQGARCSGNPAWRVFVGLEGVGLVQRATGTTRIAAGEALAVPVAEPDLTVVADAAGWTYCHVTLTDEPGDGRGFAALLAGRPPVRLGAALLGQLKGWKARWQRVMRARPSERHMTPTVTVPATEAIGLAADLLRALAAAEATPEGDGAARRVVARAREVAGASRRRDLSAKELASALGISRKHLSWAFAACGLPGPYHWLREQRMLAAAGLLREGRSVAETARALGFADASAFSRGFAAVHGATPSAWRARHAEN